MAQSVEWLGHGTDDRGTTVRFSTEPRYSSVLPYLKTASDASPALYSMEAKWPGRETGHSPPSSLRVQLHISSLCLPGVLSNNFTFYHITVYPVHGAISNPDVRIQHLATLREILVYLDLTEARYSSILNFRAVRRTTILWNSSWGA